MTSMDRRATPSCPDVCTPAPHGTNDAADVHTACATSDE